MLTLLRKLVRILVDGALIAEYPLSFVSSVFSLIHDIVAYTQACDQLVPAGLFRVLLPLMKSTKHPRFSTRVARIAEVVFCGHPASHPVFVELGIIELFAKRLSVELDMCEDVASLSRIGLCRRTEMMFVRSIVDGIISAVVGPGAAADAVTPMACSADTEVHAATLPTVQPLSEPATSEAAVPAPTERQTCSQERKSFLKAAFRVVLSASHESAFATTVRTLVETPFLGVLETILRGPDYFGTTLWGQAAKWVTDFCNNEPAMLPVLQDAGIPKAIFAVLSVGVPPSAEVLSDLPGLLSALCLNARGLEDFLAARPLNVISSVFLNKKYLPCMTSETPFHLGSALDELLRHQPSLMATGVETVLNLLQRLVEMGSAPGIVVVIGKYLFLFIFTSTV